MPSTYTPIATQTLGSNVTSITFSSIPSIYTDLILISSCAVTGGANSVYLRFNGDTTSNYSWTYAYGDGTSAASGRGSNAAYGIGAYFVTPSATLGGSINILNVMNYANTTTNKTAIGRSNANGSTYPGAETLVNLWRSTAAISSIALLFNTAGPEFVSGSTFTLYGIKAA
jgi:hypothetical protein